MSRDTKPSNGPRLGKPSMRWGALVVAVVLMFSLVSCGDDGTDGPQSPASNAPQVSTEQNADEEAAATSSTTGNPDPASTKIVIDPSSLLLSADAEVTGFGSNAVLFTWGEPRQMSSDLEPVPAEEAACAWTKGFVIELAEDALRYAFEPDYFTAAVRVDQNNHVSVAVSGDIITGGFSIGGEGRGNSQQWIIEGGEFEVAVTDVVLPNPDAFDISDADLLTQFEISATWSGLSIENFTSEESNGTVTFTCTFGILPGD